MEECKLEELGANTRQAAETVNVEARGPGPDYLGQETVDVDGHPNDRPGVLSRLPEEHPDDRDIDRMDTGVELPVLLESNMRSDPIEGTQGSFRRIIEAECPRCGYDRARECVHTLAGEHKRSFMACHAVHDDKQDDGYRMPRSSEERAEMMRTSGPTLGKLTTRKVVDLEPDTGFGPRVALVDGSSCTSLYKDDVEDLFWMLVENEDITLAESIKGQTRKHERLVIASALLPDGVALEKQED
jgi:hypothetical protein